jgi:hypothetical protein
VCGMRISLPSICSGSFLQTRWYFRAKWARFLRWALSRVFLVDGMGLDRMTRIIRVAGSRLK